ncbi:MAG: cbb3-type cytochrome oxidase assembly protein CcoS [Proteobacteria bacterium]|nr:cbb3-type cytochrome oxidase assembly protein CcoS [Pseudomonadota bacterium]MBS0571668.1 cbb3-type cytochrome oxidase assembly protein CcoS [Pseudomonadota bacterium]
MSIGFLIPLCLAMGLVGLMAFVWSLYHGQFDDPEGDARRILDPPPTPAAPKPGPAAAPGAEDAGCRAKGAGQPRI